MSQVTFSAGISDTVRKNTEALFGWLEGHRGVGKELPESFQRFMDAGTIDAHAKDSFTSDTLMHLAAANGQIGIMDWLHQQGVNVDIGDRYGSSSVYQTIAGGQLDVMKWLHEQGADIISGDIAGYTPLHYAVQYAQGDMAKWLIEQGADVNHKSNPVNGNGNAGDTPLHFCMKDYFEALGEFPQADIVQLLLDNGANINARDQNNDTPMMALIGTGYDIMTNGPTNPALRIENAAKSAQSVFDAWHNGSLGAENLTQENIIQMLMVWPLEDPKAPVPRFEQLDAIFKDARWKDEHAEHKLDLIQQIPHLTSREHMFLMGGHARALMQRQNVDKEIER